MHSTRFALLLLLLACGEDKGLGLGEGEGEGEGEGSEGEGEGEPACERFSGQGRDLSEWSISGFGAPDRDYDWEEWFMTASDSYTDGLNWGLLDLTGDGAPDLVVTQIDAYVTGGDEAEDGLGRSVWMVYENKGDRFAADPVAWSLPSFGAPDRDYDWDEWFKTTSDSYTDGLNWSLTDLTGDGAPDLVVTQIDEYVTGGDEATDGLGRSTWMVYENVGDGFASSPTTWSLPSFGRPDNGYTEYWDEWFKASYDAYTDGLNWSLQDMDGDDRPDLVVTWRDENVSSGDEQDGLGRSAWMVYKNQGDGFADSPVAWSLPSFGRPDNGYTEYWEEWFMASYDHYTDGLNWSMQDMDGDGKPDMVIHFRDENVGSGDEVDEIGRSAWLVYSNEGDGFASDPKTWALPNVGRPESSYTEYWEEWFLTYYDNYTDGLNWFLRDVDGDGSTELVVTYEDENVRESLEQDGLGEHTWAVFRAGADGYEVNPQVWNLPEMEVARDYDWDDWYLEGYDRYTDGLNWAPMDMNGDGGMDLVVTYEDEYVVDGTELDDLGRSVWAVWISECDD